MLRDGNSDDLEATALDAFVGRKGVADRDVWVKVRDIRLIRAAQPVGKRLVKGKRVRIWPAVGHWRMLGKRRGRGLARS